MYKLFRYFFFLAYLLLIIMYFLPHPEFLSGFYKRISDFYDDIPSHFTSDTEQAPDMRSIEKALFAGVDKNINGFLNDLSVENALDMLLYRSYDDFVYLVDEYLAHNQYFEDIAVYEGSRIIYKLNQAPANNLITFVREYRTISGVISIEFMFNTKLLQNFVDKSYEPVVFEYRSRFFNSDKINPSMLYDFKNPDGVYNIANQTVYKATISQNLKTPLTIYVLKKDSFDLSDFMQILFIMCIPLIWVILMVLDRFIVKFIESMSQKRKQKALSSEENDLDWLDKFVESEDKQNDKKDGSDENR